MQASKIQKYSLKGNHQRSTFAGMVVIFFCCSAPKTYTSFSDWDSSQDRKLNRSEFVNAYINQNYFDRWSQNGYSLSYSSFFEKVFDFLDKDHDGLVGIIEFNSQIKSFYFGLFSENVSTWDDDVSASISKTEFIQHVSRTNLASVWDTNADKNISESEMAGGMFYIGDVNGDGVVDEIELNLWKRNRSI